MSFFATASVGPSYAYVATNVNSLPTAKDRTIPLPTRSTKAPKPPQCPMRGVKISSWSSRISRPKQLFVLLPQVHNSCEKRFQLQMQKTDHHTYPGMVNHGVVMRTTLNLLGINLVIVYFLHDFRIFPDLQQTLVVSAAKSGRL